MTAAPAFARKRAHYAPLVQVALDYLYEKRRVRRRGFVAIVVRDLAAALNRSEATARRALRALTEAGEVVRLYNGGQGRRRACIYYVGKAQVERARQKWPEWNAVNPKRENKPVFPGLLVGQRTLERRHRKAVKNDSLNASDSSCSRGGVLSELPPLGDQSRAQASVADRDAPPERPPVGGSMPTQGNVADAGELQSAQGPKAAPPTAQKRPRPDVPLSPPKTADSSPRGARAPSGDGSRSGPARAAVERRTLFCRAWGEWRERYRKATRKDYRDHPGADARAMTRLVRRALLRAAGDHDDALAWLCWWFRRYLADRAPPGAPLGERHHPLFRLVRLVDDDEYGTPRPPASSPPKRTAPPSTAEVVARAALAALGVSPAGDPSAGGERPPAYRRAAVPPPDAGFRSVLERARDAHRNAHRKTGLPPPDEPKD